MRTATIIALTTSLVLSVANASTNPSDPNASSDDAQVKELLTKLNLDGFVCGTVDQPRSEDQSKPSDTSMSASAAVNGANPADIIAESQYINTDLDGNYIVDIGDLLIVLKNWGTCNPASQTACNGDVNGDGFVDNLDLIFLLSNLS